ncbi:MAG: glutamate synthase large subunit [Thermoguttaceae bacterium]|nr:glutamate synthase large subunit [Thermoguttaceae bacterium]
MEQFDEQSGLRLPEDEGLYSFRNEHDACGVGLIADLNNRSGHDIIEKGIEILKRLTHRGAAGKDPETGDGAGILVSIPDQFFKKQYRSLPAQGQYGIAMLFGFDESESGIERIVREEGTRILFWREVPAHPEALGQTARKSQPLIRQAFIDGEHFPDQDTFQRKLYVIRRRIEKEIPNGYVVSCSSQSLVYKGLMLASQLDRFYPDLGDTDFTSPLALVHQRYSTNTFPTWQLAHPFRFLAHNGEINTLHGNLNQLRNHQYSLESDLFGDDLQKILPLIDDKASDSAALDSMLELLCQAGRSLPHAMMMLVPQAWGEKYHLGRDVRGFFDYHSSLMEPWDGPAALAFSDGRNAGAILDRNGLRPARYTLTTDGLFVLASETGVLDFPNEKILRKGRLKPGEIIWADLQQHRLIFDAEMKNTIARQRPYRRWAEESKIVVNGLFDSIMPSKVHEELCRRQRLFGWSLEDLEMILAPMAENAKEPIGSMGNDAALAVLSRKPQLLFGYFKQLFAQVTNPPIDPIREELVMSLTTYIGNQGNILSDTAHKAELLKLSRPILTDEDIQRITEERQKPVLSTVLKMTLRHSLKESLQALQNEAVNRVRNGYNILILSDMNLKPDETPIPSLLAVSAVNRALSEAGLRPSIGLIVQSGEVREVMHYALLIGYGATAIHPWLALETVEQLVRSGKIQRSSAHAAANYIKAVDKGLLKIMSKMGISTLRSYRSAQLFEAVGINPSVIDEYFTGTVSRIGGIDLDDIQREVLARFQTAQQNGNRPLMSDGVYHFRKNGENHLWTPEALALFRQAVRENNPDKYRGYASLINEQEGRNCTLRGLFRFVDRKPISLKEVEPVEAILKRFVSGAMSLGSLSPEAHETIAIAMNQIGAMSNCGEGGEDPNREAPGAHGEDRRSAIRQIASGRFGVTIDYLAGARELQIKMAQGAKPGEGGQLPGIKVDENIARVRHSTPYVTLISPPPHHDIYSIEDLAQLIFDLHNANREARVSVKLVSETGVGTIAAGVAKGHADVILISGHDGGTGASPLTSVKHAGLPWELGLAETQQTLVKNGLRGRVRLQVDGQIKTGRDVMIGALLGAEEFGFATTLLVCLGCVMMRKCHENSCPVGVATQDPTLRRCFSGKPEYIVNFLRFVAAEVREYLAQLGFRTLDEAIGRCDLLETKDAIDYFKLQKLDFSKILTPVSVCGNEVKFSGDRAKIETFDEKNLIPAIQETLTKGTASEMSLPLGNVDRAVGTTLSSEIARKFGPNGLPDDSIQIHFHGVAGQSFGAFLAPGITLQLEGEANDFVGKGISGGKIVITPPPIPNFRAEENVIAGNVVGYGGTRGKIFLNGRAGERFAVRNSGFTAVVEGVGDHGCEYMTGGRVVVLGTTGVNFAAGMTGGIAYVFDENNNFDLYCNTDTVDLESISPGSEDETELTDLLREHAKITGSARAKDLLNNWQLFRSRFIKVIPFEYKQAILNSSRPIVPTVAHECQRTSEAFPDLAQHKLIQIAKTNRQQEEKLQ